MFIFMISILYIFYDFNTIYFLWILYYIGLCSGARNYSRILLHEVVLHESLKVEVSQLIGGSELEKLGKLGVGVNLAAIVLVLEVVGADVLVNLLANRRAGHLSAGSLSEKLGKLLADERGLDEAGRLAVA